MIQKLMKSIREYKTASIKAPVFVSLEVVMECVIPLIMANLIDQGISAGNMPYIWKAGLVLLLASFASLLFGVLSGKYASVASAGFAKNLRGDMYRQIQTFSFANIDRFSTGGLVTRLTTDVSNVQNAYQMIIRTAVRSPFMLLFSLIAAISIDAQLSLIFAVFIPILGVGLYLVATNAHPIFERVFRRYDRLNNVVQENLSGIRVVKAFVREEHEVEKFDQISTQIYQDFSKAERILAFNMPLMQFCVYGCMLLLSWFGAKAVVACGGEAALGLSTGELTSLFTYTMQILSSLMMLSMVFVMIVISRASAERIVEVLDESSDITTPDNAVTTVADGSIDFNDVVFRYNNRSEKPVLDHIDLHIQSGQTIGILGGTGSSKSSLVQLIPRLYDVTEGSVCVGGVDVRRYDLDTLRNAVSFVLQKNELFSGTIKDNLRWGNEHATDEEMKHACELAQADSFIQGFPDKYDTYIEQGGTNVSGGQKQRLCIARALLKKPKVLVLDDSTSAVDTATDAMIRKALKEERGDMTKIIIAQRVGSVMEADQIIVLDEGRVAGLGTHDQLLKTNAIYREVYESQMKGSDAE
ncbi:MAG: ABC transporter ATP-binding protein/permease [Clostridiales bacterium]|nr:ABC transporter ATP-binding protein/permease [Clostridiales bacterium]